jgi:penicillin amidase
MNLPKLLFRLALGRRLPITSGSLQAPGVRGSVNIRRDGYGIPYVEAQVDEDAWYGLGFCQGQDRAFQLEILLRISRGTLAELLGPDALPVDRLSRHIGFLHSAHRQLKVLQSETRGMLEAYARGVSEGSSFGCRRKAHEFTLLRCGPTPFTAADAVAISKLQSFALASNWDIELARLHILRADGPDALLALDPTYPEWLPVSFPPGAPSGPTSDRLSEDLRALRELVGHLGGSNTWALAPSRPRVLSAGVWPAHDRDCASRAGMAHSGRDRHAAAE